MKKLLYLLALLPFTTFAAEKIAEVEHGTDSVILQFELYDETAPEDCPATDVTDETVGMQITLYDDVTNGQLDRFECTGAAGCGTIDTIEPITTLGTYATPTATMARFEVMEAGSCWYQLQLANAIFDTVGANVINIEITDNAAGLIIDSNYWVDLSPISSTTLIANLLATDCSSYSTPDEVGYQLCTIMNAILQDTGVTNKALLDTIDGNTAAHILLAGGADSGTTLTIVDAENLTQADNFYSSKGASVIVEFSGGSESRCVRGQTLSTNTISVSPAFTQAVGTEAFRIVSDLSCRNFP